MLFLETCKYPQGTSCALRNIVKTYFLPCGHGLLILRLSLRDVALSCSFLVGKAPLNPTRRSSISCNNLLVFSCIALSSIQVVTLLDIRQPFYQFIDVGCNPGLYAGNKLSLRHCGQSLKYALPAPPSRENEYLSRVFAFSHCVACKLRICRH